MLVGPGRTLGDDGFLNDARAPYDMYAEERYVRYSEGFAGRRAMFDRLGQFKSYGSYGVRWNETRDKYTDAKRQAGLGLDELHSSSSILSQDNYFNFLAIVRQQYGDEFMAATVGRNIATTFSPLVMYRMQYGGLRVDYSRPDHELTFVLSRGGSYGSALFSDFKGGIQGVYEVSPVLVYGANWVGHFGALRLGASLFRQAQSNATSSASALWNGDVPYEELQSPRQIIVRVTDDDPQAGEGAALLGAAITVAGTVDSVARAYTSDPGLASASVQHKASMRPDIQGRWTGTRWEAEGSGEHIEIVFDMPPDMVGEEARIELQVQGDYRIAARQEHDFIVPGGDGEVEQRSWPSPPPVEGTYGVYFKDMPYETEPFYTVVRADGDPAIDSAPRTVRFSHAIPTAQSFMGVNLELNTRHLRVQGEVVANPQVFQFPTAAGDRLTRQARAGYLTLLGKTERYGCVGVELFRLDPTYGGWHDSRRGGLVLFTDAAGDVASGEHLGTEAVTQEFTVFDDNDDHDNWPDDRPFSGDGLYVPQGAYDRPVFPASRPEGGVFPGFDMDGDLVLDFDKNRNAVMDWTEPFLGYAADPPEFVYGQDFNNNLVPDFRENDDEPDYPYRRDQQGGHLFYELSRKPWWLDVARLGMYRTVTVAGGQRAQALYGRLGGDVEAPSLRIRYRADLKRVQDSIPDDLFRIVLTTDPTVSGRYNQPSRPPVRDFLPMRNSLAGTGYLETDWFPAGGLRIGNNVKLVLNRRMEIEPAGAQAGQDAETHHNLSVVNKLSCKRQVLSRLTTTGRLKHLLALWDEGSYTPIDSVAVGQDAAWSLFTPELLATYTLTPKTSIEFGQHGLFVPFLQARYHDYQDGDRSYTSNVSLVQLTMRGEYGGYNLIANVGLRREDYDAGDAAFAEDADLTAFFVDLIFGVE